MAFQPGNQEHKKADRKKPRIITQQLISALNEPFDGDITKMRKVVDGLVAKAIDGDVQATKEILDRVDGKVPQPVSGGDPDDEPIKHTFQWLNNGS